MRIRVLFFGQARELAGAAEHLLDVEEGATVERAAELLGAAHPRLRPLLERCSFALDRAYATRQEPLGLTGELAVLPPIGGG